MVHEGVRLSRREEAKEEEEERESKSKDKEQAIRQFSCLLFPFSCGNLRVE